MDLDLFPRLAHCRTGCVWNSVPNFLSFIPEFKFLLDAQALRFHKREAHSKSQSLYAPNVYSIEQSHTLASVFAFLPFNQEGREVLATTLCGRSL